MLLDKGFFCLYEHAILARIDFVVLAIVQMHVRSESMRVAKNYSSLSDDNMKTATAKYFWGGFHIDLSYN